MTVHPCSRNLTPSHRVTSAKNTTFRYAMTLICAVHWISQTQPLSADETQAHSFLSWEAPPTVVNPAAPKCEGTESIFCTIAAILGWEAPPTVEETPPVASDPMSVSR